ncbi:MAG: substrate-binding domain-containing protein [Actinomycetota bacterium]
MARTPAPAGRHAQPATPRRRPRWGVIACLAVLLLAAGAVVAWRAGDRGSAAPGATSRTHGSASSSGCPRRVRAVTAASYAPVLRRVAHALADGAGCVDVQVTVADGRGAAAVVAATKADVWIPDDASWRKLPNPVEFAPSGGATIATSPLYFVMDAATAARRPPVPSTWVGLAGVLATQGSTRLVMADPASSGDGLVAGAALTDSVFKANGPLISAYDLMRAWQVSRTVNNASPALPQKAGEVGIVPEYALRRAGPNASSKVVAPTDATALMRYTWYPTSSGVADPDRSAALGSLYTALTGPAGQAAITEFSLRAGSWPAAPPTGGSAVELPSASAAPMPVTSEHHMWHVLTTWNPAQRAANILVVVDVSGSMASPAPGTSTPLIALVRQGVGQVNALLPDTARLGLWQFGAELDPPRDYQELVPTAPLTSAQRAALTASTARLGAKPTGTGLYDTILAAYRYQQAHFQAGMPNEVLLFTDGVNEEDPNSIDLAQLKAALAAADPAKHVQIGILAFGTRLPVDALKQALSPVGGQVDPLPNANQVVAAYVHAVSVGLTY